MSTNTHINFGRPPVDFKRWKLTAPRSKAREQMRPPANPLRHALFAPLAASLLAGCAAAPEGAYPSLAIRDVERVSGTLEPPAVTYVPPAPPSGTLNELDALVSRAQTAHGRFVEQAPALRSRVASANGAPVGSEGWAQAQVALAELETIRSEAMIALADLDRLYVEAATEGQSLAEVASARDEVIALVEQEDAVIAELAGEVSE